MAAFDAQVASAARACTGCILLLAAHDPEKWKRDLEKNYQSDEFLAGAEFDHALDALYAQLKALLTELELVRKP